MITCPCCRLVIAFAFLLSMYSDGLLLPRSFDELYVMILFITKHELWLEFVDAELLGADEMKACLEFVNMRSKITVVIAQTSAPIYQSIKDWRLERVRQDDESRRTRNTLTTIAVLSLDDPSSTIHSNTRFYPPPTRPCLRFPDC